MANQKRHLKGKTLVAVVFAAGLLQTQMPANSTDSVKSTELRSATETDESVIQKIANNAEMSPEIRSYFLLQLAQAYLANNEQKHVNHDFNSLQNQMDDSFLFGKNRILDQWVAKVVSDADEGKFFPNRSDGWSKPSSHSSSVCKSADKATIAALKQLDKARNRSAILRLYVVAENLFETTGNTIETQKCRQFLHTAVTACERNMAADDEEAVAAATVLRIMADHKIPVQIPDLDPKTSPNFHKATAKPFSEAAFMESEELKLRAATIIDRLPADSHERRKAHRDLVLWYLALNKPELAKVQKQILFQLVGTEDEDILYAKPGGCGHVSWWQTGKSNSGVFMGCGMG